VTWIERQLERLRGVDPFVVDALLAALMLAVGAVSVATQDLTRGMSEAPAWAVLTVLGSTLPIAFRRRWPLPALLVGCVAVFVHVASTWPEGSLPMSVLLLAYTVAAWDTPRRAAVGLAAVYATLVLLALVDVPGLDTLGAIANMAFFTAAWAVGIAMRSRRETLEAREREADERAMVERQTAARTVAEERLRIAQELHDVVAHSMSVIAVQAGVGAHGLDDRPEQARAALDAISATSRGALTELRRLLGVLRDDDGARSNAPAPGLADVPQLVDDVRAAGVPVRLTIDGTPQQCANAGVELSAYRVVQEALTNVMKHAGAPTDDAVHLRHQPGSLAIEVVDDGRGGAALGVDGGHGQLGMRERVELWGGELSVGPVPGGGYKVSAVLPFGEAE
jgi:signal transduction histidine kinase